jgi:glutamine synthetase
VCVIADGVDEGRYPEPEIRADYYEQEPEVPNAEPALPEDFEDGKSNLIL